MKYLLIASTLMIITGCSLNDTVEMNQATQQKFDLADVDHDGVIMHVNVVRVLLWALLLITTVVVKLPTSMNPKT